MNICKFTTVPLLLISSNIYAVSTISTGKATVQTASSVFVSVAATASDCVAAATHTTKAGIADYIPGTPGVAACVNVLEDKAGLPYSADGVGVSAASKFPGGVPSSGGGSVGAVSTTAARTTAISTGDWGAYNNFFPFTTIVATRGASFSCRSEVAKLAGGPSGHASCEIKDPWIFSPTSSADLDLSFTLDELEITGDGFLRYDIEFGVGTTSGSILSTLFSRHVVINADDLIGGITSVHISDHTETLFANETYVLKADLATYAASAVPIPTSFWLFSTGLIWMLGIARRKF